MQETEIVVYAARRTGFEELIWDVPPSGNGGYIRQVIVQGLPKNISGHILGLMVWMAQIWPISG